jgi:pimeloyl-ACP methyl ester carboxylesterase
MDFDRVYLCGRGSGVAIATQIAGRFPDRFAGVIGRAGDVGEGSPANFRSLPTYFAGAGAQASAFEAEVGKLGFGNCTVDPDGKEEDVWAWIQEHPRDANPAEVTLVPGDPFPTRAYWLQVPHSEYGGSASVHAKADRETNTIVIEAEGTSDVAVYFNDTIVDLDKPVTVICNGAQHVDEIPRSLKVTLDLIFTARSDPGKLYVATKSYHLPAKEGD